MSGAFDADEIAYRICALVGWDRKDAVGLAEELGLEVLAFPTHLIHGDAELVEADGGHVIHVRDGLSPQRLSFSVLHELGHRHLGGYCVREHAEEERKANAIAAALQMPIGPFLADAILCGPDYERLARRYGATQTAAALRFGEVTGRPTAVLTPARLRVAGDHHPWPSELEMRWRVRRGLVKAHPLTDEPMRAVVTAA